jgi:signal transduction histidine kinase
MSLQNKKTTGSRIAELEKYLQIEASLERVRTVAMGMNQSDDLLSICEIMFHELKKLGFEDLRNAMISIHYDEKQYLLNYEYRESVGKTVIKVIYNSHPIVNNLVDHAKQSGEGFTEQVYTGKALDEWRAFRMGNGEADDPRLYNISALYYYFYSIGTGAVGISIFSAANPGQLEVLKRFRNVFDLAYKRYIDITNAGAQAREAQIQLALERIRARTMAMQKSDELAEMVSLLFKQLLGLGIRTEQIRTCGIVTFDEKKPIGEQWITETNGEIIPKSFIVPYDEAPAYKAIYKGWKEGEQFMIIHLEGEKLKEHLGYLAKGTNVPTRDVVLPQQAAEIFNHVMYFSQGCLFIITKEALPEYHDVFKRFGAVFQQSYTRFLDLQKAEEQAREAQIETALERVRSRTMGMQHSDELREVIQLIFEQLKQLNFNIDSANFALDYKESDDFNLWLSSAGQSYPTKVHTPYLDLPIFNRFIEAKKNGVDFLTENYSFEEKNAFFDHFFKNVQGVTDERKEFVMNTAGYARSTVLMKKVTLSMQNYAAIPYSEEENAALRRFGKVFEQTYTRFLDLQQAEAQAREAKIEAGLERVRSRSLAMHESDELRDVVKVVFERLQALSFCIDGAAFIVTPAEIAREVNIWIGDNYTEYPSRFRTPFFDAPVIRDLFDAINSGQDFFSKTYSVNEKNPWFEYAFKHTDYKYLSEELRSWILAQENLTQCFALAKNSGVGIHFHNRRPLSENEIDILKRFSKVFEQSYIRFLDLQKAETQAREAKIEAALEKVRGRAMAMHQSQDINTAVLAVFEELEKLNLDILRCGIGIIDSENQVGDIWTTVKLDGKSSVQVSGKEPMNIHPLMQGTYDAWLNQTDFLYELTGDDLVAYYRAVAGTNFILPESHSLTDENDGAKQYYYTPTFKTGNLYAFRESPFPDDAKLIMKRFASVLNLTFSRFLDLQKAEAQAREAQIEASLERVRSKAMAMRNSGDLLAAASTVFTELHNLGISQIRSGVGLITKDFQNAKVYSATSSQSAVDLSLMGEVTLSGHPVFEQQYQSWLKQENYFAALEGKELAAYYKILSAGLNTNLGVTVKKNQKEYGHWFMFTEGFLYAWSDKEYTDAEIKVLERFKNVMELTIRRYIELQKSEMQAREAVRQASLDRVRAEIASMRTISDLDRITPLIWNELTILGVPFIRCGVFMMDEPLQLIHTYLSTPDGKAIAAFQLHFNDGTGNGVNQTALTGWRNKQVVTLHWTEEEFRAFSHNLVEQGEIASEEGYLTERPPTGLDLHFFPFLQGMLYAGNTAPLSDDDKDLVQSLADAFSTAYARYEDFNRLELAKKEVERTLTDLKAAQTRLIQSEKMASLGELTAGIAHEIQNPLNFVNNFSEVNQDLLEELKAESLKPKAERDEQLEIELINDLINNEQKINHHGKRADGIVKGMLQHSRTAGGEKQLTNINALADEYMRLSYHGLRAKDKGFNAEMLTHFDENLPKVSVVPQDIGRVLLNLFNNAFYAVNLKKKTAGPDYKPTVEVITFTPPTGGLGVKVKDNGVGIPNAIKEKIMQPFFTTKPTGEGTGLGLSLTYDMVVKGHGGSIAVTSTENEGAEFIISLPKGNG